MLDTHPEKEGGREGGEEGERVPLLLGHREAVKVLAMEGVAGAVWERLLVSENDRVELELLLVS